MHIYLTVIELIFKLSWGTHKAAMVAFYFKYKQIKLSYKYIYSFTRYNIIIW